MEISHYNKQRQISPGFRWEEVGVTDTMYGILIMVWWPLWEAPP